MTVRKAYAAMRRAAETVFARITEKKQEIAVPDNLGRNLKKMNACLAQAFD